MHACVIARTDLHACTYRRAYVHTQPTTGTRLWCRCTFVTASTRASGRTRKPSPCATTLCSRSSGVMFSPALTHSRTHARTHAHAHTHAHVHTTTPPPPPTTKTYSIVGMAGTLPQRCRGWQTAAAFGRNARVHEHDVYYLQEWCHLWPAEGGRLSCMHASTLTEEGKEKRVCSEELAFT